MKKLGIEKSETHYRVGLDVSDYDFLEVIQDDLDKRITIKFLDTRWRTTKQTIKMLEEVIDVLKNNPLT